MAPVVLLQDTYSAVKLNFHTCTPQIRSVGGLFIYNIHKKLMAV